MPSPSTMRNKGVLKGAKKKMSKKTLPKTYKKKAMPKKTAGLKTYKGMKKGLKKK
jgi:hypothetical protein